MSKISAAPPPVVVTLPNGQEVQAGDVGYAPRENRQPVQVVKVTRVDQRPYGDELVLEGNGHKTGHLLPEQAAYAYVFPPKQKRQLLTEANDNRHRDFRNSSSTGLPKLGDRFQLHGPAGKMGDSWMLALHQRMAYELSKGSTTVDRRHTSNIFAAEETLKFPGGYNVLWKKGSGWRNTPLSLVKNMMKVAVFTKDARPTLAAVQTNKGTWLTVIDNQFLEVNNLSQLRGPRFGDLEMLGVKARYDDVSEHIDPAAGTLLKTREKDGYSYLQELSNPPKQPSEPEEDKLVSFGDGRVVPMSSLRLRELTPEEALARLRGAK